MRLSATLKRLMVIIILILSSSLVRSQVNYTSFILYNIDTTAFPKVSASLYAVDAAQSRYRNFNTADIDLFENNVLKNSTLTMNCDTSDKPIPVAVCLTLDQSFSMGDKTPANDTYWDWVKFGARTFIDSIKMVPPTCIAITSFGGNSYVRAPFQTVKPPLYTALDKIPNEGGTNYDEAFLNLSAPNGAAGAIAVMRNAPAMLRRFVIILTDGQPDKPPSKQRIIDSCLKNAITVFAINISKPNNQNINADLADISTKTGGRAYLARSKAEMASIYRLIAQEIQRNIDCRLSWISTPGCTQASRTRTLRAVLKKGTPFMNWSGSYVASAYSVADPQPSVNTISFDDPGTGNKLQKTLTITAPARISIRIDRLISSLPGVFNVISTSKPLSATLNPGESIDAVVEFTQSSTGTLHSGTISIVGSPCSATVNVKVIIPVLKLVTPVGRDTLNGCDSIPIVWSGIAEDEAITVMYSSNNGAKWNILDNAAKGLQYKWFHRVEHDFGTDNLLAYRVKVQRSSCRWISDFGDNANDSAKGLCLNSFTKDLGVCGSFDQRLRYGGNTIPSFGKRDGFLAFMNQNGVQRLCIPIGGSSDDEVAAVDADLQGNYIIAGNSTSASLRCGDSTLIVPRALTNYGFVASIDTLGKTLWCVAIGDSTGLNQGELMLTSVRANSDSSVTVQGYHRGVITSIYTPKSVYNNQSFDGPNLVGMYFPISIDITKFGKVRRIMSGFTIPSQVHAQRTVLSNSQAYMCGSFDGTIKCAQSQTMSFGQSDAFVRACSLNPGSDSSAKSFSIFNPLLIFEATSIDMGPVDVGKSFVIPVGQPMRNDGSSTMNLLSLFPSGIDSADFSIELPSAPGVIGTHSNPEIRVRVTPRPIAHIVRNAYLIATSECSDPAYIRMTSAATFPNLSMIGVDFKRRRIGSINYDTMKIHNEDPGSIPVKSLSQQYNLWNEFSWSARMPADSLIRSKSEVPIIVRFVPTHIEPDSLEVRIDTTQAIHVPVSAQALGSGFLPRCSSKGYHFYTVPRLSISPEKGFISISNIDSIAPLRIYSSHWRAAQSDDFHEQRALPDTSIAPGDTVRIPIQYYPLKAGLHSAYFVFEHDAAPGPDPLPRAYDTVHVDGDAIEMVVDSSRLRFVPILSCDTSDLDFRISNKAGLTDLPIKSIILLQSGSSFDYQPKAPFVIKAGETTRIHVDFNPSTPGAVTATLIVVPDSGLKADTLLISADAASATLSIARSDTSMRVDIGGHYLIQVSGALSSSTPFVLDTIAFALRTNPSQARFATERFQKQFQGWQWSLDSSATTFIFSGSHTGATIANPIHFMELPFDVYLSQDFENTMKLISLAENVKECLHTDSTTFHFTQNERCYTRGSSIRYAKALALRVAQDDRHQARVRYVLNERANSRLEIVNSLGRVVYLGTETQHEAGDVEELVNLDQLSSGLYFVRLSALGQSDVQAFFRNP